MLAKKLKSSHKRLLMAGALCSAALVVGACVSRAYNQNDDNPDDPSGWGSGIQATPRGAEGQALRCNTVLPAVESVGVPLLKKLVERSTRLGDREPEGSTTAAIADRVAVRTKIMLKNMMLSNSEPIHPVAFFSMVKDFESSVSLKWATSDARGRLEYFKTGNCDSGECFGLFQVDVRQEPLFKHGAICQRANNGLDIWGTPGGPDFCAATFWWTVAAGGDKCSAITDFQVNPCRRPGTPWTLEMVNFGRKAYVQQAQWGSGSWRENYLNYKACLVARDGSLEASLVKFREAVGLVEAPVVSGSPAGETPEAGSAAPVPTGSPAPSTQIPLMPKAK